MSQSLRTLLVLSLLLNVLLAGILLGHSWQSIVSSVAATPEEIVAALPAETRTTFNNALADAKTRIDPLRTEVVANRHEALCLLSATPFDKKAYMAKVEKLHVLHGKITLAIAKEVTAVADQLPPHARLAFADMLRPPQVQHNTVRTCDDIEAK